MAANPLNSKREVLGKTEYSQESRNELSIGNGKFLEALLHFQSHDMTSVCPGQVFLYLEKSKMTCGQVFLWKRSYHYV